LLEGIPPEAFERMRRYVAEVNASQKRLDQAQRKARLLLDALGHADTTGIQPACEAVIKVVQRALAERAPGPISVDEAHGLFWAEFWALHALYDIGGHGKARRVQLEVCKGAPLATCRCNAEKQMTETLIGQIPVRGQGCLRIFELPTRTSGRMWSSLCPDCRPRNGKRQPLREAQRALRRRVARNHGL
jgi:hypothetical protein